MRKQAVRTPKPPSGHLTRTEDKFPRPVTCYMLSPFPSWNLPPIRITRPPYCGIGGDSGLVIGQVGTIVVIYAPDAFEVGFCTTQGTTIALTKLAHTDFLVLRHDAVLAA